MTWRCWTTIKGFEQEGTPIPIQVGTRQTNVWPVQYLEWKQYLDTKAAEFDTASMMRFPAIILLGVTLSVSTAFGGSGRGPFPAPEFDPGAGCAALSFLVAAFFMFRGRTKAPKR